MDDAAHNERRRIEIEQQADPASGSLEVCPKLGKVCGVQRLDRLQFNDKSPLNEEVQSSNANLHSFKLHS